MYSKMNVGIFLLFLLLPSYLIRFSIGPLPTTALEVIILIIVGVWIIQNFWTKEKRASVSTFLFSVYSKNKLLVFGTALFLLGATISVFTSIDIRAAAGEWKAFYVEPILIFVVLVSIIQKSEHRNQIFFALILSGLATSLLAIYQNYTGFMVPEAFWKSHRVTAWYGFPNGVGLFLAPLVPLALYLIYNATASLKRGLKRTLIQASCILFLIASIPAIIFAKSTGALVGIAAGIGIFLVLYKKTRWPVVILGVVGLIAVLNLPTDNAVRMELLAQDRSGQIRKAVWSETVELLRDRPILGAGLASYDERIIPYHKTVNGEGIEIFHHPHNLFLTMYVNLGLTGLVGFLLIAIWFYNKGFTNLSSRKHTLLTKYLISAMTVILVTGLVDSPYIKNDLAVLFWLLPALMIIITHSNDRAAQQ